MVKKVGERWDKRTNEELKDLYNELGVVVKAQRMRWTGHVERIKQGKTTKAAFVKKRR